MRYLREKEVLALVPVKRSTLRRWEQSDQFPRRRILGPRCVGWSEDEVRDRIYFAAVCRCFPGKRPEGGDRVPSPEEIEKCAAWLEREVELLRPQLVLPVGKLAISRFLGERPLAGTIGKLFPVTFHGHDLDCIPLPHPSGASPWHRMEPGKSLLARALKLIVNHEAWPKP